MGFLNKLRCKKDETVEKVKEKQHLSLIILKIHNLLLAKESKDILRMENQSMNKHHAFFAKVVVVVLSLLNRLSVRIVEEI